MSEFAETLREINERLDVPQPARSRVLLEIAADLNDLYDHFRGQGVPRQEARRMALDRCDLSSESLSELIQVHTSPWSRFMDRFSAQAQTWWERAFLAALLVLVAAIAGRLVLGVGVFRTAPSWVWAALAITFGAVVFSGYKLYVVFVKQDHSPRRLRGGLSALLVAAGADLLIGAYGYWLGLYRAARRTEENLEGLWLYAVEWLLEGSSLLIVCFTAAILISLLWYVLANKVARVEQAEAAVLLNN
jgi:hypothetical protein